MRAASGPSPGGLESWPALLGVALFVGICAAEFGVLWAWQAEASRALSGARLASGAPPPAQRPGLPWPGGAAGSLEGLPWRGPTLRSRIAIVIDDWGYDWPAARRILAIRGPLTIAVLPFLPGTREQAWQALRLGHEVLVHLPMEPVDFARDPGPGAIYVSLPGEAIEARVEAAVRDVPGAVGANNHMGSRATADPRVMAHVMAVLRRRGLFFLDSATTAHSAAAGAAARAGVPWLRRGLFLDVRDDPGWIEGQLRLAAHLATERGAVVVIGHVRPATAAALERVVPQLESMGVELVPLSALLGPRAAPASPAPAPASPAPAPARPAPAREGAGRRR